MRMVDESVYEEVASKLSLRAGFVASIPGFVLFVIVMFSDFLAALLLLVFVGGGLFGLVYGIRKLMQKGAKKRINKYEFNAPYINVYFFGYNGKEPGVLEIDDDKLRFRTLVAGSANKEIVMNIDQDLFLEVAVAKKGLLGKLLYGDIERGVILAQEMSSARHYRFVFEDIDNALEKVSLRVSEVSKFDYDKYQK